VSDVVSSFPASTSLRGHLRLLLALVAAGAAGSANAQGFVVGGGAGASRGKVDCEAAFPCDHSDTGFKVFAGYQFNPAVDARLSYFDDGSFQGSDITPGGTSFGGKFKVSGFGLTAGYLWNFAPAWSLHAEAGVASMRTRFEYAAPFSGSVDKTTVQPLAGLSLGYAVTPSLRIGLDYDVTRFKAHDSNGSMQTLGLSAQFSF
jgi:OOP family OmpA-OmpF porin